MQEKHRVVIFYSTSAAIKTESITKKKGLAVKLIPVPRHLSSDCGICLRFDNRDREKILEILTENKIEYDDIYQMNT